MTTQITVDRYPTYDGENARLRATLPSGRAVEIDVYGPAQKFGEISDPTVNWPAIGSVSAKDAAAFADLIFEAARVAPTLAGPDTLAPGDAIEMDGHPGTIIDIADNVAWVRWTDDAGDTAAGDETFERIEDLVKVGSAE